MTRQIEKPMALATGTYFRLRVTDPQGRSQLHNQPFATREAADAAAFQLWRKIVKATGSMSALDAAQQGWAIGIVPVTAS